MNNDDALLEVREIFIDLLKNSKTGFLSEGSIILWTNILHRNHGFDKDIAEQTVVAIGTEEAEILFSL